MSNFRVAERGHVVQAMAPQAINTGVNSDVFSLKNYAHASIIVAVGAVGTDITLTVEECDDFTPSNSTAIAFNYYVSDAANGDTIGAKTAATAAGITILATGGDNKFVIIEIEDQELTDGFPALRVVTSASAGTNLMAIAAVLSGQRFGTEPTAIA